MLVRMILFFYGSMQVRLGFIPFVFLSNHCSMPFHCSVFSVNLKNLGHFLQDMESIVETMMQQLLSKEILQEPMKEIGERYPKWLEDHKASLSAEEYERYSRQYKLIKDLNEVYEKDPSNFNRVVELMQKMQECGQPPNDIVQELAPDFDLANLGQM